jgi:hypothetical protein
VEFAKSQIETSKQLQKQCNEKLNETRNRKAKKND